MRNYIRKLIDSANMAKHSFLVVIIGNVKGMTRVDDDYAQTSIVSEYYSQKQYDDIVNSLRKEGYTVKCYFDELDFIHDYSLKLLSNLYPLQPLVINFAQKGIFVGRKSLIPAFCDINHIVHTNSNAFTVSLCREKFFCSRILSPKFHIADSWLYSYRYGWMFGKPMPDTKIIVKLRNESSSIGLTKDNVLIYREASEKTIKNISETYQKDLIIQRFIKGYEVEVPFILADECHVFDPVGISLNGNERLNDEILDYEIRDKHLFDFYDFSRSFPDLSTEIKQEVYGVAKLLTMEGVGRIDFRIDDSQNYYITDINANPHITKSMTIYYAMKKLGFEDYADTVKMLIGTALNRRPS